MEIAAKVFAAISGELKYARIPRVGARGAVLVQQFNGKQEGDTGNSQPNLRCPRNGK